MRWERWTHIVEHPKDNKRATRWHLNLFFFTGLVTTFKKWIVMLTYSISRKFNCVLIFYNTTIQKWVEFFLLWKRSRLNFRLNSHIWIQAIILNIIRKSKYHVFFLVKSNLVCLDRRSITDHLHPNIRILTLKIILKFIGIFGTVFSLTVLVWRIMFALRFVLLIIMFWILFILIG